VSPPARIAEAASNADRELETLSRASGLRLDAYKEEHVAKQVQRALGVEALDDLSELARLISRDGEARERFRAAIAVSVSSHFRDPEQFELLERELLPMLLDQPGVVRVWSAGCADGSELYNIGKLLERSDALQRSYLLGSDILAANIRAAAAQNGPEASPPLRARVRWEQRDVVSAPTPPGRWRLILCRNLAIYLRPEWRDALHDKLAEALARGGVLMLGRSERIADPESRGLTVVGAHCYRRPV
jgi:chemotaxis protein methyltransferase CheR